MFVRDDPSRRVGSATRPSQALFSGSAEPPSQPLILPSRRAHLHFNFLIIYWWLSINCCILWRFHVHFAFNWWGIVILTFKPFISVFLIQSKSHFILINVSAALYLLPSRLGRVGSASQGKLKGWLGSAEPSHRPTRIIPIKRFYYF